MEYKSLRGILIIILFSILLGPFSMLGSADEEPNNFFKEAENVSDGQYNGMVVMYDGYDTDIYSIDVYKDEIVSLQFAITEGSYLTVMGYKAENKQINGFNMQVTGDGNRASHEWENCQNIDKLYLMVAGDCEYNMNIKTSMTKMQGFISNFSINILIVIIAIIFVVLFFLLVTRTIIKTINLSISHGFEDNDDGCKSKGNNRKDKPKVKLKDRKKRYDCMPIVKDKKGIERMMHHDDENIMKDDDERIRETDLMTIDHLMDDYKRRKKEYEKEVKQYKETRNMPEQSNIDNLNRRLEMIKKENEEIKKYLMIDNKDNNMDDKIGPEKEIYEFENDWQKHFNSLKETG